MGACYNESRRKRGRNTVSKQITQGHCLALFDRRNIKSTIQTTPLGPLSSLQEANDFLDEFYVALV